MLLCSPLSACIFSLNAKPLEFVVSASETSIDKVGCNQGLQASIITNGGLYAESPRLLEGEYWQATLGSFSALETTTVTIEAFCFRENEVTGYIKVEGNILASAFVDVSEPLADFETSCLFRPYDKYQPRVIESSSPIPCVIAASWEPPT